VKTPKVRKSENLDFTLGFITSLISLSSLDWMKGFKTNVLWKCLNVMVMVVVVGR
jgi:hypothetical protein